MKKKSYRRIVLAVSAGVILLAGYVGFVLKKPSGQVGPLNYPTEGTQTLTNPSSDGGLLGYAIDQAYDWKKGNERLFTNNEALTEAMINDPGVLSNDGAIKLFEQFVVQDSEYTKDFNSEKSQKGMKRLDLLAFDFLYNNLKIRDRLFTELSDGTQIQIKDLIFEMKYMYDNGYPEDKKDLIGYENAVREVIKSFK